MRLLHLYCHRAAESLVQGPDSPAPVTVLTAVQEDKLRIFAHSLTANLARPNVPYFIEQPFDFTSMRVAIGLVDQPPRRGTFRLRVLDQTTAPLTWPAATALGTADLIAAWKLSVLTALKALSNVADDAIRADDPTGSPAHFLDFAWTDPTRIDVIELVENRLFPRTRCVTKASTSDAGYAQRLKLIQFPFVAGVDFSRPTPPPASIVETREGTTGTDAEQTLIIPAGATGSLALTWSGVATATIDLAAISATALAAALNAIVAEGASNPSFTAEARSSTDGSRRYAIGFTGPLRRAAQPALVVVMHDQVARSYVVGDLPLTGNFGIEQALNGDKAVDLILELNVDNEESYLVTLTVANSLTDPDTISDLVIAGDGAVLTLPTTVYVDSGLGEAFASIAPGTVITPPAAADNYVIYHGFNSYQPGIRVHQKISDAPETWRECKDTEYANATVDLDHVKVSFPQSLSTDATVDGERNPWYRLYWRISVTSPDIAVTYFAHKHSWDDILQTLPSGMTLTAKLAAIDAALGMLGGSLTVDASKLTGLLSATQIDLTALGAALGVSPTFAAALAGQLGLTPAFTLMLATVLAANPALIDSIGASLKSSATFTSSMRTLVLDIIQGTGNLPDGSTLWILDEVNIVVPEPQEIAAAPRTRIVPATVTKQITSGDSVATLTSATEDTIVTPVTVTRYVALSPKLTGLTNGGTVTGQLPPSSSGLYYTVGAAGARSRGARGRRGLTFVSGDIIGFGAGHWYKLALAGIGTYSAAECECVLIKPIIIDASAQLVAQSRFALDWQMSAQLAGEVAGEFTIIAQIATVSSETLTWATIFSRTVRISPVPVLRSYGLHITRAANDGGGSPVLTGEYLQQGHAIAFPSAVPTADFAVRVLISRFDCEAVADPRGSLIIRIPKGAASASIISTT